MREKMSPVADGKIVMLVVPLELELEQVHLELHKWTSLAPVDLRHVNLKTISLRLAVRFRTSLPA